MTETTAVAEAPARSGKYVALVNLSVSRPDKTDKQADRVERGEVVTLTDEEAHGFRTRHRVPVIRPYGEEDSGRRIVARDLFGRRPAPPEHDKLTEIKDSTQLVRMDGPEGTPPDPSVVDPDAPHGGKATGRRGTRAT